MSESRFYITTPIYYINASPHLGHAYTTILCDVARRYHMLMGQETYHLTGTDEHGENIQRVAQEAGITPQALADQNSARFREVLKPLMIMNDDFIRTTEERHKKIVQSVLQDIYEKGDIYKAEYEGLYCAPCERFYTEKELDPETPDMCPIHELELTHIKEENYFFRMGKYQDWLREKIEREPGFINPPQFANEVLGILRDPLDDLCISRPKSRVSWGIELPFDVDYVAYVWFDALLNYLSAIDFPDGEKYEKYWPVAQHVIAKDILRPHAVFWPTMLKAMGLPTYRRLHVHGYWQSGGKKMSKTLGNVVDPIDFASRYSPDALRYYVMREMPLGSDGDFTEEAFVRRYNSDLANDFGNLVSRVAAIIKRSCDSKIPEPGELLDEDRALLAEFDAAREAIPELLSKLRTSEIIESILQAVRAVNRYVDQTRPWDLAKSDKARLNTVLHTSARAAVSAAGLLWPAMPAKCDEALRGFGIDPDTLDGARRWSGDGLTPGAEIQPIGSLFPRQEIKETPAPAPKEKKKVKEAEEKPLIQFDDFTKLDLRVATIIEAEPHPDADRLLKLMVNCGDGEPRQIIAGLAKEFSPEDLVGKQVVVVANLAPIKLRGLQSTGMVLCAHDPNGLRLISPVEETVPGGSVS